MVIGISMVKDEADVVETTIRHMAGQVDALLVADNGSIDGTRDVLSDLARDVPLEVIDDPEVAYYQSAKMSRLAAKAAEQGARWVVPFDADELWVAEGERVADALPAHADIVTAAIYDHRCTAADDANEPNPVRRMGWRTAEACPLVKVACRPAMPVTIHQGNHSAAYPTPETVNGLLRIHHYPIRSADQMIRKARNGGQAYAATDLPEGTGTHWRQWNQLTDDQLRDVFREHYFYESTNDLVFDPCVV